MPTVNNLFCFCPECAGSDNRRAKWTRLKMKILKNADNKRQHDVLLMGDEIALEPPATLMDPGELVVTTAVASVNEPV